MALTQEATQEIQRLIEGATGNLVGRITELERILGESRSEATTLVTRLTAQEQATVNLTAMIDGQTPRQNGRAKKPKDITEMKAIYNLPVFSGKPGE